MLCQRNYTLHINVTKDQKFPCNGRLSAPEAETTSPTFRLPPHTSGPACAASSQQHHAQLSHNLNARPSYLMELAIKIARGTRGGGIRCFSKQELKFHPQKHCIKYTLKLVNFWYWKTAFWISVWQCFWRGREKAHRSHKDYYILQVFPGDFQTRARSCRGKCRANCPSYHPAHLSHKLILFCPRDALEADTSRQPRTKKKSSNSLSVLLTALKIS